MRIKSTNSKVVSIGFSFLCLQIFLAILLANRSSPYSLIMRKSSDSGYSFTMSLAVTLCSLSAYQVVHLPDKKIPSRHCLIDKKKHLSLKQYRLPLVSTTPKALLSYVRSCFLQKLSFLQKVPAARAPQQVPPHPGRCRLNAPCLLIALQFHTNGRRHRLYHLHRFHPDKYSDCLWFLLTEHMLKFHNCLLACTD